MKRFPCKGLGLYCLVFLMVSTLSTGCGTAGGIPTNPTGSKNTGGNQAPNGGSSTLPIATSLRSDEAVIEESIRLQETKSYRSSSSMMTGDGRPINMSIEYVPPDRYHITSGHDDFIVIGEQVYLFQGPGYAPSQIAASSIVDGQSLSRLLNNIDNVACSLTTPANGKSIYDCSFTNEVRIGTDDLKEENRLLIDADTKLPYRLQVNGYISAIDPNTGKPGSMKASIVQTYTYDPTLKIELP